jgi:hypothetical protein
MEPTMRIAIDFDGTIVDHQYPAIGKPVPYAFDYIKEFRALGAQTILWTMRDGWHLDEAVEFCAFNNIHFDSVNKGIDDRNWTQSPKAYANIYIDDAAFGVPLLHEPISPGGRPVVDWLQVGPDIVTLLRIEQEANK